LPESATELAGLYRAAAEATARGSKSFYFASRFFPPDLARSAYAVYWFCRLTDDLVDEAPDPEQGRRALDAWQAALQPGSSEPALRLFLSVAEKHAIPLEYAHELIEGVRMDLTISRYQSFEELRVFCYRVASVVGLMMMHVIGFTGQPQQQAIDLGIALQLTNILRDVGEDLGRGRVYLPLEELARFGLTVEDLQAETRDGRFRSLMRFQAERARDYYARGMAGIPALHRDGRFSVEIAARVYAGILAEIERNDYDVYRRRAVVPAAQKYWITARAMAPVVARRSMERVAFWR
jgi:phytoene synthase